LVLCSSPSPSLATLPQIAWQEQQAAVAEKTGKHKNKTKERETERDRERERGANNTNTRKAFLVF